MLYTFAMQGKLHQKQNTFQTMLEVIVQYQKILGMKFVTFCRRIILVYCQHWQASCRQTCMKKMIWKNLAQILYLVMHNARE